MVMQLILLFPRMSKLYLLRTSSVKIIDVSTLGAPVIVASITASAAYGIDVAPDGNTVYVADQLDGLCVIDVSGSDGLSNPDLVECLSTPGFSSGVKVSPDGQYVYVADFGSGVGSIEVLILLVQLISLLWIQMDLVIRLMSADGSQIFLADSLESKPLT